MASKTKAETQKTQSRDEQIGFHKGSLSTLLKERQEMIRILGIVEQLVQMHMGALKELGVDIQKDAEEGANPQHKPKKKPIEDIL
jgi:biotin operon repressor